MERRIAEAETLWLRLCKETYHQIDALYVIVIDTPNFLGPLRVFRRYELLETLYGI